MENRIAGIDVSRWQGEINWPLVAESDTKFVIMKATEGTNYTDTKFNYNWENAKKVGLYVGAYCFFRPGRDAKGQADYFLSVVDFANSDISPVIDLEVNDGMTAATVMSRVKIWIDRIIEVTGRIPILYSSPSFLNTYFSVGGKPPAWAKDMPLWIANWTSANEPYMPKGWTTWAIWQYTNVGKVPGITGYVDLDWAKLEIKPEEPVGDYTMTEEELLVLKKLDAAKEAFLALNILRDQDQTQFAEYIDAAKNIVLVRPVVRELNK